MKKTLILLTVFLVVCSFAKKSFASDWDNAGKILASTEGLRILTKGNIDILGNITGISSKKCLSSKTTNKYKHCAHCKRIWVPNFIWKKKWISTHKDYNSKLGKIIVEGHYIRYKVEKGGQWKHLCKNNYSKNLCGY